MNRQIECLSNNLNKSSIEILAAQDFNSRRLKMFDQQIDELHKNLQIETNKTFKLRNQADQQNHEMERLLRVEIIIETSWEPQGHHSS
jgi:hypothetical protein